jgi:hypothetical protein
MRTKSASYATKDEEVARQRGVTADDAARVDGSGTLSAEINSGAAEACADSSLSTQSEQFQMLGEIADDDKEDNQRV